MVTRTCPSVASPSEDLLTKKEKKSLSIPKRQNSIQARVGGDKIRQSKLYTDNRNFVTPHSHLSLPRFFF